MVMLLLQAIDTSVGNLLEYQRAAILEGQGWRLVSGHFTHINQSHLLLNLAGLVLIWAIGLGKLSPLRLVTAIFVCCVSISCALLVFNTDLTWYRGFSGVLHGLFALVAAQYLKDHTYFSILLFLSLALKVIYEQILERMPWHQGFTDFSVISDAHLYGSITGLIIALMFFNPWANLRKKTCLPSDDA
jgi:rhomboid family GlyGly-CTERM serine protease